MGTRRQNVYRRGPASNVNRVVVLLPKEETEAVDAWGVPAGMPSRTAAIRHLIRKGLEAMAAGNGGAPAAGEASRA